MATSRNYQKKQQQSGFRNRIVGTGEESPDQLLAHPGNWRVHPREQQEALEAVLNEVGWVQQVIVNRATGKVLDGHLRVSLAISREEPSIPVVYVDVTENEEKVILASLDPLAAMAVADNDALRELTEAAEVTGEDLRAWLDTLAPVPGGDEPLPPEDFESYDEDIPTAYRCPRCSYEWSGKPS